MIQKEQISQLADLYFEEILKIRRDLHRQPELSNQEYRTSERIQQELTKLGIPFTAGYVMTGIVARLEGEKPGGKTLALRADMDALPIRENTSLPFASENTGVMHACGHDVHMASLLGAAKILHTLKAEFAGTILLIFQPAEERIPGGARGMIAEGALKDAPPEIFLAQHVMPELLTGQIGVRPGVYMASTDEIYITVKGKGGHAALPDQLVDSVLIASHLVVALQQISSRMAPPSIPTVLSFGRIEADGANNVIPSEVRLFGTFRTQNESWRKEAHGKIRAICESVTQGMGAGCEVDIQEGYPEVYNDPEVADRLAGFARQYLGEEKVLLLEPQMTAEDFAYFAREAPSTLFRLGTGNADGNHRSPLHAPDFSVDEEALRTGMGLLSWLTLSFLNET